MTRKLPKDTEFSRQIERLGAEIGGKRSLQTTMTAEQRSEPAIKATILEALHHPTPRSQALILADEILNRLNGYARKGSRPRNNFYERDLNWMADVLMRVEAGERDPLRPTGQ